MRRGSIPTNPWAKFAAASIEKTGGQKPNMLPNLGGSLPNEVFTDILGMPTVWVPHSYAACSQHAPDEHLLAPVARDGLRLMTGIFWDLGARGPPAVSSPMLTADEAADLIEAIAVAAGPGGLRSLFRHYAPRVKAFIMRGGADAEAAQEVAQEALIMVWRKAASFDRSRASAATWIFTIARNKRIDLLRRSGRPADRDRGLAGGFCARRGRRRQIRPGRTNVYPGEGTLGRPLGRSAGRHPQGLFRGQDPYGHRRGTGAAARHREVAYSPGPGTPAGSVGERRDDEPPSGPRRAAAGLRRRRLGRGAGAGGGAPCGARSGGAADGRAAATPLGGALIEGEEDAAGAGRCRARARAGAARRRRRRAAAGAGRGCGGPASNGRRRRLRRYLAGDARWQHVLGGFEEIRCACTATRHRVSLLRLKPGRGLPLHRHVGDEYTVVLQGGYTDTTGNYGVGDFCRRAGPEQHEPIADPGEPCIALIVVEKPIVLTGPIGRWLNPLVSRGWL